MQQNEKILYLLKFDNSKTLRENTQKFLNEQKNPADIKSYPACVASETNNSNRAELKKSKSGQYYIELYVRHMQGYQFYHNGRVKKPNGEMGNYSCEGRDILIDGVDISSQEWLKVKDKYVTDWEKSQMDKATQMAGLLDDMDVHDALAYASMAAYFFGPWGKAISVGLDLTNAYLYHKENKDWQAGLQIAFSLIPGADLINEIPIVRKKGIEFFEKILLKSTKGGTITKAEREAWDELMKHSKWIKSQATKQLFKKSFQQIFKNFRLVDMIKFMWLFQMKHPYLSFVGKLGIQVGGIYYTWSKLAKIFGITDKKDEDIKMKTKIQEDYNKSPESAKQQAIEDISEKFMSIPQNERDSILLSLQQEELKKFEKK